MTQRRIGVAAAAFLAAVWFSSADLDAQEEDATSEEPACEDVAPASADEPPPAVREEIVVTANRFEAAPREVGSSVTVITAEEIELKRKSTVAELLRTVPGVEVVRGGGPGQITSVFVRGGSSSQTLVLLDGVRLNAPTTGAFDFANLTADSIERIEIVRGPQSTIYGSEAVTGIISIFSKSGAEGLRASVLAEAGGLGARRFLLSVDGGSSGYDSGCQSPTSTPTASPRLASAPVTPRLTATTTCRRRPVWAGTLQQTAGSRPASAPSTLRSPTTASTSSSARSTIATGFRPAKA